MYPVCMWHGRTEPLYSVHLLYVSECNSISEPQLFTTTVTRSSPTVAFVELAPSPQLKNEEPEEKEQKQPENEMSGKVELVLSQKVRWTEADTPAVLAASRGFTLLPAATAAPLHSEGLFSLPIFFPIFKMYTFLKTNIIHVHWKKK